MDGIFALNMLHIYCGFDDICLMLDDLNEDLKIENKRKSQEIRKQLIEIVKKHQNLIQFERLSLCFSLSFNNFPIFQIHCIHERAFPTQSDGLLVLQRFSNCLQPFCPCRFKVDSRSIHVHPHGISNVFLVFVR
jgi:hypothetical protein